MKQTPLNVLFLMSLLLTLGTGSASGTIVFDDFFGPGVEYQAFQFSDFTALTVDSSVAYSGSASLKITVPDVSSNSYAGGAFLSYDERDLTPYNAVTFWARSNQPLTLDVAGLGNDNAGTVRYEASRQNIALTTSWSKIVIPVPLPSRLTAEKGLLFFAKDSESSGLVMWFDEIVFENLASISNPRPSMPSVTREVFVGESVSPEGTTVVFDVGGTDHLVQHMPGYFTFFTSNPAVAIVNDEILEAAGAGSATITAKLGSVDVTGTLTLSVTASPNVPAPDPEILPADHVISLFSDSYVDVPVDTWSASWDMADVTEITIAGNSAKAYSNLLFAGILFETNTIDASDMLCLLMDVWIPSGTLFRVKLVDFGPDNQFAGGDDSQSEITFSANSSPPLTTGQWQRFEIPLADFVSLAGVRNLAQLLISGDSANVFVDNVMFASRGGVAVEAITWGHVKQRFR